MYIYTHTHIYTPLYINHFFPFPPEYFERGHSLYTHIVDRVERIKTFHPVTPLLFYSCSLLPKKRVD